VSERDSIIGLIPLSMIPLSGAHCTTFFLEKYLLYKCPELKSKDFKPQEKRERKIGKSVGVHAVGGVG
jgi:hypothetical protein